MRLPKFTSHKHKSQREKRHSSRIYIRQMWKACDIVHLKWLTVDEHRYMSISKLALKGLDFEILAEYGKIKFRINRSNG